MLSARSIRPSSNRMLTVKGYSHGQHRRAQGPDPGLLSHDQRSADRAGSGRSQETLFVCSAVQRKGVEARVLKGRSGPEDSTIARGNYASCRMRNSRGRDIWTLTSSSGGWAPTIMPDWGGLLVRQVGSGVLIRTDGKNANKQ